MQQLLKAEGRAEILSQSSGIPEATLSMLAAVHHWKNLKTRLIHACILMA